MKLETVITAISLSLILAPAASAAEFELDQNNLSEYKETANQHLDELPDFVKNIVGDQDINVYIDSNKSESHNLSLQMKDTTIETIDSQSLEKPNIEVWTSSEIIEELAEANHSAKELKTSIKEDEIRYQANDTWTKIKLFFAETFMNFL